MTAAKIRGQHRPRLHAGTYSLVTFAVVLYTDCALKLWAQSALVEPVRLASRLYLTVHLNPDLFLGFLPISTIPFIHWFFVCGALVWLAGRMTFVCNPMIGSCFAMVAGGVMGNALGRLKGGVVDYLAFGPVFDDKWMIFNFADFAMLGGSLFLGGLLVGSKYRRQNKDLPLSGAIDCTSQVPGLDVRTDN